MLIVGGGVAGLSVGYQLAMGGETDVLVIEAEDKLFMHSTGRSAAYYIPMYESVTYGRLAQESLPFLQQPPEEFGDRPIFSTDGAIIAVVPGAAKALEDEIDLAERLGVAVSKLDPWEIEDLVPVVRPERIEAAAFYPSAGEIDVGGLVSGYLRSARTRGIQFSLSCQLTRVYTENSAIVGVGTTKGDIACECLVNAAGAWAGYVGELAGALPITFTVLRRHLLSTSLPSEFSKADWPFFRCPTAPLYFKPSRGSLMFSPMDQDIDGVGNCDVDRRRVDEAVEKLSQFTTLSGEGATHVAGHRIFAEDKAPILGADPVISGLYWAAGAGGAGIMAAPAIGRLVANEMLEGDLAETPMDVHPRRFI